MAISAACLFTALLVALIVDSPADAQEVGPSGSFQTSYPIEIPSYHGLEPDLGLNYDSSAGNGLLGVGWELAGFSSIQRASPGKGAPNYDESDVYFLDGMELIPCESATPTEPGTQSPSCEHRVDNPNYKAYATKTESFRRIAFDTSIEAWYVWGKDGTKTTYQPYSLFLDSSRGATKWRVFSWSVETIQEPADDKPNSWRNIVEYSYGHASNEKYGVQEQYPMFIDYKGAHTRIRFSYEERPDTITSATGLNEFSTVRYRLKTIDVTVSGQRARAYELRYKNGDSSTGRSLLSEVQEYGRDTAICYTNTHGCDSSDPWWKATFTNRGATLPPVTFAPDDPGGARVGGWTSRSQPTGRWSPESGANAYDDTNKYKIPSSGAAPDESAFGSVGIHSRWLPGDLNGDGRDDLILINARRLQGPFVGPVAIGTAISRPDGSYDRRTIPNPWGVGSDDALPFLHGYFFPGDFDGDGKTDLIGVTQGTEHADVAALLVAISNGDGTFRFEHQYTDLILKPVEIWSFGLSASLSLGVGVGGSSGGSGGEIVGSSGDSGGTGPYASLGVSYQGLSISPGGVSYTYSWQLWQDTDVYMPQRWSTGDTNGDGKTDVMLAQLWEGNATTPRSVSLCTLVSTGDPSRDNPGGPDDDKELFGKQDCYRQPYDWDSRHVAVTRVYNGDFDGSGTTDFAMIRPYKDSKPGHPRNTEYARIDVALSGSGEQPFGAPNTYKTDLPWNEDDVTFPGDPNGDGRTDLMQVIKCPSGKKNEIQKLRCPDEQQRSYDHAALRTYLSGQQGTSFAPTAVQETGLLWHLPSPCWQINLPPTFWYPGDPDGDGRTDFIQMYKEHDHKCHLPDDNGLDMALAYSRPDGTFDIHDPSSDPRLRTDRFWRQYWHDPREAAFIAADVNGDGKDDVVFAKETYIDNPDPDKGGPWEASTLLSPNTRRDSYHWQAAEINGDGRADLVYVENLNPGIRTYALLRGTDGSFPVDSNGKVTPTTQDIDHVLNVNHGGQEVEGPYAPDPSRWLTIDVNADGRSDLVNMEYEYHKYCPFTNGCPNGPIKDPRTSGVHLFTLLSNGDGQWQPREEYFTDDSWSDLRPEEITQWKPMDVDGDGRVDLVHIQRNLGDSLGLHVTTLFSKGDGSWVPESREPWPNFAPHDTASWRSMDVNGDGKVDLLRVYNSPTGDSSPSSTCVQTLLSGFTFDESNDRFSGDWTRRPDPQKSSEACLGVDVSDTLNWKAADVNGDGKADLVHMGQGSKAYVIDTLLSTGSGNHWQPAQGTAGDGNWPDTPNWKPEDVNGDGRTDLVHVQALRTRAPSYTQTDTLVSLGDGQWKTTQPQVSSEAYPLADNRNWQSADADGDGMDDLVRVDYVEEPDKDPALQATAFISDSPLDLTTDFSNGMGGKSTVDYAPSSRWVPSNARAGCPLLPTGMVLQSISSVTTQETASGVSDTVPYSYACPRWSYPERSFLGYEFVVSSHAETLNSPKRHTFDRYKISDECGARIGVSEERAADQSILSRTETYYRGDPGWDHHDPGSPPYDCLQESSVEYQCDAGTRFVGDSACAASRTEFSYDDTPDESSGPDETSGFGNITETRECSYEGFDGNYNTVAPGCEKTSPNDQERTTLTEYNPASGPYIVGLPSRKMVFQGLGHEGKKPVRDTRYCYDYDEPDTCKALPSRGLLTATKEWDDQNQRYLTTAYEYDVFGNQTEVTDANGHPTTTKFDDRYHLFPEKTCNALGQCTEQVWDPVIDQVVQSIDTNGFSTYFNYDKLGRPTQTCNPDGGVRQLSYHDWWNPADRHVREFAAEDSVAWCEGADENSVNWKEVDENSVNGIWTETYLDGLERTKVIRKEGDEPGVVFEQDTLYVDSLPHVYKQSHWYETGQEEPKYEEFHYDEADRLTRQVHPDENRTELTWEFGEEGTRTWASSRDELGHEKTMYSDAFGRAVQVREINRDDPQDTTYDTRYEYDALDNLTRVTDDKGNVRSTTWDSLGRQLSTDDPDMGLWTFSYDNVGNLTHQTDAKGKTTEFTYDEINRSETKKMPNGDTTTWHYDEDEHGESVGRLTSISGPTGLSCEEERSENYVYDKMGQIVSEAKCVLGKSYEMGTEYDVLGRQKRLTYPDGEVVEYGYDTAGRLENMSGYVDSFSYDAAGHLTAAKYDNGTEESFEYDPAREWLETATVRRGEETLYQAGYEYKSNALVESTSSTTNDMNLSFTYDDLNRLTKVTKPDNEVVQSFGYDSIGNMTHNSKLGDYEYPSSAPDGCAAGQPHAGPHAVQQAGSYEYEYDCNGNMTLRDGMEILWNEENQPEWVEYKKNKWEHYLYDASGERVFKDDKAKPKKNKEEQGIRRVAFHKSQYDEQDAKRIVVSPGDSLWLISSKWLGPNATPQQIATAVEQIYALNRNQIGPDPDLIFVGQEFLVPPTWRPERDQYKKGKQEHHLHDASGERALKEAKGKPAKEKQVAKKGTFYFGPRLSYTSSGRNKGLTKYYYAGPMLIASKNPDGTHWFHQDHLGSTRLVTDHDGEVIQRYDYEPFGLGFSQPGAKKFENDIGFGGHRADANTGLTNMGARYYDPQLARFISPDSIVPEEINPQALNRYSYVYNNPVSYTDPTGHQTEECSVCDFTDEPEVFEPPIQLSATMPADPEGKIVQTDPKDAHVYETIVRAKRLPSSRWRFSKEASAELATALGQIMNMAENNPAYQKAKYLSTLGPLFVSGVAPHVERKVNEELLGMGKTLTVGAAGKVGSAIARARATTPSSQGSPPSAPVGRSGAPIEDVPYSLGGQNQPPRNSPTAISGRDYSGHALDRMQGRGIPPSAVENTIRIGQSAPGNVPGTTVFYDRANNLSVVTNSNSGRVITVRPGPP